MSKRRFQVFVSSTFEDLQEERQAAVEAILQAGHIPAGMELFTAGSESQLDVVRQWIKDSDIYMLIVGARYGSIEPKSGLSYTEVEFNYACELGKPFFSVIISDEGRELKVKAFGSSVIETKNPEKYHLFRQQVESRMCAYFQSVQDIKLVVFQTLPQIASSPDLAEAGWIPASEAEPSRDLASELTRLLKENRSLSERLESFQENVTSAPNFERLRRELLAKKVVIPIGLFSNGEEIRLPLLQMAVRFADNLAAGVSNSGFSSELESFLMYNVAGPLTSYGLMEHDKVSRKVQWKRLRLAKEGVRFLNRVRLEYPLKPEEIYQRQGPDKEAKKTEVEVQEITVTPVKVTKGRARKKS